MKCELDRTDHLSLKEDEKCSGIENSDIHNHDRSTYMKLKSAKTVPPVDLGDGMAAFGTLWSPIRDPVRASFADDINIAGIACVHFIIGGQGCCTQC